MINDSLPTSDTPETMAEHAPGTDTGTTDIQHAELTHAPEPLKTEGLHAAQTSDNHHEIHVEPNSDTQHETVNELPVMDSETGAISEEKNEVFHNSDHSDSHLDHEENKIEVSNAHSIQEVEKENEPITEKPTVIQYLDNGDTTSIQTDLKEASAQPESHHKVIEQKAEPVEVAHATTDGEVHIAAEVSESSNNMIPEILQKINTRIEALELQPLETQDHFKAFWSLVKVTNETFKHYSKLIPKETHEELWKRFDQLCERAKQTQESIKSRFENVSRTKRGLIETTVTEASDLISSDLIKADVLLRRALKFLKDDWSDIRSNLSLTDEELKVRMGREDQDAAWQLWKSTNEHYMTQQQQVRQNNFISINKEVMEMKAPVESGDPFEALTLIKNMQAKLRGMHLPKGDWEDIQNILREYWDLADKRVKHAKQNRGQERRNKDNIFMIKHQQWVTRQESNISRFKDLIRKNEEVLKNLEEHTEKLKNDLTTAMSDKFKEKIEDWIKEKENKIADIIRTNADLEKRIVDIRKKLEEGDSNDNNDNLSNVAEDHNGHEAHEVVTAIHNEQLEEAKTESAENSTAAE